MSIFGSSHKVSDADILALITDYVQESTLTDRERTIGQMAKAELEKKHYSVRVVQRVLVSLQREAIRERSLTPVADTFYHQLSDMLLKIAPIGTNQGAWTAQLGYLD
jgi:hypothetical protein